MNTVSASAAARATVLGEKALFAQSNPLAKSWRANCLCSNDAHGDGMGSAVCFGSPDTYIVPAVYRQPYSHFSQ